MGKDIYSQLLDGGHPAPLRRTLHRTPLGYGDTPLAALPSEGCPHYYPRAVRFRLHPDRFSKAGKTILDPSMRTVHTPPELNQWSPIPAAINGARVAPSTGISLRSLPFIKRKIRKRRDA